LSQEIRDNIFHPKWLLYAPKDLKQLLQANVVITDAAKNQTTTLLTFQQEWGFSPEHIVDYY